MVNLWVLMKNGARKTGADKSVPKDVLIKYRLIIIV